MKLVDVLIEYKLAESRSQARRLISQGGVFVNGVRAAEQDLGPGEYTVRVGKRHSATVVVLARAAQ